MPAKLVLLVALAHFAPVQPAPTVPLIIDGQVRVVSREEAQRLFQSSDPKLRAAAQAGLMIRSHHCDHTPSDAEIECFDK